MDEYVTICLEGHYKIYQAQLKFYPGEVEEKHSYILVKYSSNLDQKGKCRGSSLCTSVLCCICGVTAVLFECSYDRCLCLVCA